MTNEIYIDHEGNLNSGGVSINLPDFVNKQDGRSNVFIQDTAPTDYLLGDIWKDPIDKIDSVAVTVDGKLRWIGV